MIKRCVNNVITYINYILTFEKRCARQSIDKSAGKCQRSTAPQFRWKIAHFSHFGLVWLGFWIFSTNVQEEKCATTYKQECHPVSHEECHPGSSCWEQLLQNVKNFIRTLLKPAKLAEYENVCHDVPEQKCYTAHEDVCSTVQVSLSKDPLKFI